MFNTSLSYNIQNIPIPVNADTQVKVFPRRRSSLNSYEKPMELCLCGRCANAFYNLPDHVIQRVDPDQYFKDKCDYCSERLGYDYQVYKKVTS